MIDSALNIIVDNLNTFIRDQIPALVEDQVVLGNISLIDAFQDESTTNLRDKVVASVINIEQESTLRNLPYRRSVADENGLPKSVEQSPEIYLNVYVLFGANKSDYRTALQLISTVLGYFQRRHVFTPDLLPALASVNVQKLIFDLYSTSFEELNHLWGIMGGKYVPSIVYKMRMVIIQMAEESGASVVEALGLNENSL